MALPYVPVPFPSVVYPSSSNEPARTVQSAAELSTLNMAPVSSLPGAAAPIQFALTPTVVPKPATVTVTKPPLVTTTAHPTLQAIFLKNG